MHIVRTFSSLRFVFVVLGLAFSVIELNAYTGTYPPANTDVVSAVPILASVSVSPPSITLNFSRSAKYQIFRKSPASTTWGTALTTFTAAGTTWTDTTVSVGQLYEYKAVATDLASSSQLHVPSPLYYLNRAPAAPTNPPPYGYIMTGIQVDETLPKGRVILVVTTDVQAAIPAEVAQYQKDLLADGWFVHVIPVAPAADYTNNGTGVIDSTGAVTSPFPTAPIDLRNQIIALYNQYPGEFKNVILLGKVPACRTGALEYYSSGSNAYLVTDPDGHLVNRAGYGADGYYANMTGTWTDTRSNYAYFYHKDPTSGNYVGQADITAAAGTLNVPGDNKFDQFYMQETGGQADMGFGRIDLSNGITDQYEALRFYLNKLHRYKSASPDFLIGRKFALRGGGFPTNDELFWMTAPAVSGDMGPLDIIKNATPPLPVVESPSFDAEAAYSAINGPYIMMVQGSGGPGISIGGKAMMWTGMQSHWGWWYSTGTSSGENTMALRLGEDSFCLSYTWNIFGLRYFYHRMSMGFDTGDMARVSINNTDSYNGTYAWTTDSAESHGGYIYPCSGGLFMDHFGDPTLHLYTFAPPTNLSVVPAGGRASLSWTASTDSAVTGYHVYRQDSATSPYVRLTGTPITGTTYTDNSVTSGARTYMVRAIRLETTGGGTFYNASLGAQQAIDLSAGPATLVISSPAALPDAYWNTPYVTMLTTTGGTPNFTWTLVSGALPPGLTLNADGTFAGTITQSGAYNFTAQVVDATGQTKQQAFTLTAQSNDTVAILPEESAYVYSSAATRVQGPTETVNVSGGANINHAYFRFPLSALSTHNSFVSAKLRFYVGGGTTAGCIALMQAALTDDAAGAAWTCSGTNGMSYNTQPADNSSIGPVTATSTPVAFTYLDLDVTPLMAKALAVNASGKISFHLSTSTLQNIQLCSTYAYGNARPQLIVQTTNAPLLTVASPTTNPVYLYTGSKLQINATATAIPARAAYLITQWSQVSGPGTVTFGSPLQPSTSVSFSTKGDYVLRLSATDGLFQSSRDVTVRVLAVPVTGPTDSLNLRLPFDETSGTTAADASGVTPPNNATLYAGTASGSTVPSWSTAGQINGAVSLNQTGQRIEVPDSATNLLDGNAQQTIAFWVYANALATDSSYRALISKRVSSGKNESYQIAARNATYYCDYGTGGSLTGARTLPLQQWTHVAFVYAGAGANNLRLYINGTPDKFATATGTGVPRNAVSALRIGAYDATDTVGFNGLIDEVRIYSRALSSAEIQDLYNSVPSNIAPVISLSNASVSGAAGSPYSLGASVTDDGKPVAFTLQWRQASGPGSTVFGTPTATTTTGTSSLAGTYTLQLAASDGAATTVANVTASIRQSFTGWTNQYNLSGANALDGANPSGDGVANLLKYAFGMDPTKASTSGLPTVAMVTGSDGKPHLTITYRRLLANATTSELTYAVQVSDDLLGWDGSGTQVEQVGSAVATGDGLTEQVQVRLKAAVDAAGPRKTMRVQVSRAGGSSGNGTSAAAPAQAQGSKAATVSKKN